MVSLLGEGLTVADLVAGAEKMLKNWRPQYPGHRILAVNYCRPVWRELLAGKLAKAAPVRAAEPPAAKPRPVVKVRELKDWERLELTMQVAQVPVEQQAARRRALLLRWGVLKEQDDGVG
jgi:hypothetical protein